MIFMNTDRIRVAGIPVRFKGRENFKNLDGFIETLYYRFTRSGSGK